MYLAFKKKYLEGWCYVFSILKEKKIENGERGCYVFCMNLFHVLNMFE